MGRELELYTILKGGLIKISQLIFVAKVINYS